MNPSDTNTLYDTANCTYFWANMGVHFLEMSRRWPEGWQWIKLLSSTLTFKATCRFYSSSLFCCRNMKQKCNTKYGKMLSCFNFKSTSLGKRVKEKCLWLFLVCVFVWVKRMVYLKRSRTQYWFHYITSKPLQYCIIVSILKRVLS